MALLWRRRPNVERLRRKGKVERLVRALSYEDPITDRDGRYLDLGVEVRRRAVCALAELNGPSAYEGLLRALEDPAPDVRIAAVHGLRERDSVLAVEHLSSAVTNWTEARYTGARAEALEAMLSLRDPTAPRRVAAGLLTRTEDLDDRVDGDIFKRLAQGAGGEVVTATIEDLVAALRDGAFVDRARTLLVWLTPDSVVPLAAALGNERGRCETVLALGATRDARAVEPLCAIMLGDDPPPVREAAARALGDIRDPAAVEALLLATGDPDYGVRTAAGASFDRLGNAAIAMAMSVLVRPALENGAAPDQAAIAPPPERPAEPPGLSAAGPVLRRLLGRRDSGASRQ